MKTFKQFIEAFHSTHTIRRYGHERHVEIFHNPSHKEMRSTLKHGVTRAWLHPDGSMHMHDITALHGETMEHVGATSKSIPVAIYHERGKDAHVEITDSSRKTEWHNKKDADKHILHHEHLRKLFPGNVTVSHYNEALHGDWSEAYATGFLSPYTHTNLGDRTVNVFRNPSHREMREVSNGKRKEWSGFLHRDGTMHVFTSHNVSHQHVIAHDKDRVKDALPVTGFTTHGETFIRPSWANAGHHWTHETDEPDVHKFIENHPHINRLFPKGVNKYDRLR